MTDLRALLAQIDTVLAECDATKLPPVVKLTREQFDTLAEQSPTPHQLRHGGPAFDPAPVVLHPVGEVVRFEDLPWWRRILWRRIFLGRPR